MKILIFFIALLYCQVNLAADEPQPPSLIIQTSVVGPLVNLAKMSPEAFSYIKRPNRSNSEQQIAAKKQFDQNQELKSSSIQSARRENYVSATDIKRYSKGKRVFLRSHVASIYDERDKEFIFTRNSNRVMSIASLTKLMMAMVVLDAKLPMDKVIRISKLDKDRIRYSRSRLGYGSKFTRHDLLLMALMSSENRAAAALARNYPGGKKSFVAAMNKKARHLGLRKTRFYDPAGLHDKNVSTARELTELAQAAMKYPQIRRFTTFKRHSIINLRNGRSMKFGNTNRLAKKDSWAMRLSKTGFTNTAGNCLIMKTTINQRPVTMVLLNSWGKLSKYGDSNRLKKWLLKTERKIRQKRLAEKHKTDKELARIE